MPNLHDYLLWRGDLTTQHSPWCLIDSLLAANLSYNDVGPLAAGDSQITLGELAPQLDLMERTGNVYFVQWRDLLYRMAATARFGRMRVHHYVDDHTAATQFSAMTLDFDEGPTVVAFRGTDASISGWYEDFCMSYETVPAQLAATAYLTEAAMRTDRPLVVTGHSKGGNLAAYAAAHVPAEVQARLISACSFDGPGLDDDTLTAEGYRRMSPVLTSVIPQGSVVGLLMGYHPDHVIVRSTALGLFQHDSFTWQLLGPAFETVPRIDFGSQLMDRTVHDWLKACTPEDRRTFVNALFSLVEPLGATTTAELAADKLRTGAVIVQATRDMDPEMRRIFHHLLRQLLTTGASNAWSMALKPVEHLIPSLLQGGMSHES